MKNLLLIGLFLLLLLPRGSNAESFDVTPSQLGEQESVESGTIGHKLLFYIPNRILDVLDVFRARLRVGPGLGAGVRVTEPLSAYLGSYVSVYAGLPGPRMSETPRWPIGMESLNGASVSLLDFSTGAGMDPGYSSTEIGVSAQVLLVGADVGFDPVEIIDFLTGIFFIDLRDDDY